ncbi:MAG: molybdenum cofactor guanylyltransferase [Nitrososphaeria archaeon]|nr:molybdenum cofactor guanylyltransferase [Conexivisphaerales archaeon]
MSFSIIILAGGKSSRFGSDKLLYKYKSRSLLEWVANAAVKSGSDDVILVVKELKEGYREIAERLKLYIAKDKIEDYTPIAGICSGTEIAKNQNVLVISGDSPLVSPDFFRSINFYLNEMMYEAAVPLWPDGSVEVIHAGYKKDALLKACKKMINHKDYEVKRILLSLSSVYFIPVEQIDKNSLIDVDSLEDLEKLG